MSLSHEARRARLRDIADDLLAIPEEDRRDVLKIARLARKYNVGEATILRAGRERDVPMPPRGLGPVVGSSLVIVANLLRGRAAHAIARDLGVSRQRVHQVKEAALDAGIVL